jgi:hypothetical protein
MTSQYKIKIFTKNYQTEFILETDSSMIIMSQVHKEIVDFLGKNTIKWEPNKLRFNGRSEFYITYEEVNDGSRQYGVVREEDPLRV